MNSNTTIVTVLALASVLALALTILLTAGAVYWQTSTHYQEILREKDASYWEHLGRTQTQGLHCEDQCKRLIDSSNHYYSTLIAAYDERLKSLLDTDVQSIQIREESHREVLNIIHNQAVLVNEQAHTSTVQCKHYCQALHSSLEVCNNSLASQMNANIRLVQRRSRQQYSIIYMYKLLMECESDKEESSNSSFWLGGIITVFIVTACSSMLILKSNRPATIESKKVQMVTSNKKSVEELTATSYERMRQQLTKRLAELEEDCRRKDNELEESDSKSKRLIDQLEESQQDRQKMVGELEEKLARTESELCILQSNLEKEQQNKFCLEEFLSEKEKQLDDQKESLERKNKNIEKYYEQQLAGEKKKLADLVQLKREYEVRMAEQDKASVQLMKQGKQIAKELATSTSYATAVESELKELKQAHKNLESHTKVLNNRITGQNEKILKCEDTIEQQTKEKEQMQLELQKQKAILEGRNGIVKELVENNSQLSERLTELEATVIMKENELEQERKSKIRALKGYECQEERIRKLEVERDQISKTSHKKHKSQPSLEEIRLEMYKKFEVEYKRLELETYGRITDLAEEAGRLKAENTEQQIQIKKLKSNNKALKQLAEKRHTQARREEASERCRVTVDLPMVRHLSLSPPTFTSCKTF